MKMLGSLVKVANESRADNDKLPILTQPDFEVNMRAQLSDFEDEEGDDLAED
jgi:hypothetical protein